MFKSLFDGASYKHFDSLQWQDEELTIQHIKEANVIPLSFKKVKKLKCGNETEGYWKTEIKYDLVGLQQDFFNKKYNLIDCRIEQSNWTENPHEGVSFCMEYYNIDAQDYDFYKELCDKISFDITKVFNLKS